MITKSDVQNALDSLESGLPADDVNKGDGVPTDGDLNTSNGAADGGGSLKAPGDNMNDKYGNKKTKGCAAKKSEVPADFNEELPLEVETKIDVSEFLKSLVDHTADQVNGLREFVVKSDQAMDARTDDIIDEIEDVKKSLGDVGVVLKAICQRIGIVENAPATVAKSQTTDAPITDAKPAERTFEDISKSGDDTNQNATGFYKSLQGKQPLDMKKAISDALCDLVKKGELSETEVINFETYSHISPEADVKLRSVLN